MLNETMLARRRDAAQQFVLGGFDPRAEYVPPAMWGKDHWSVLAYVEVRCVDQGGHIQPQNMRCNPRLHQRYAHTPDGGKYPTRLVGGVELEPHDDWSCVEDMTAYGLIVVKSDYAKTKRLTGPSADMLKKADLRTAILKLTPLGMRVVAALRAHKQNPKGHFYNFECPAGLVGEMEAAREESVAA